jgi:hypothetical protein
VKHTTLYFTLHESGDNYLDARRYSVSILSKISNRRIISTSSNFICLEK